MSPAFSSARQAAAFVLLLLVILLLPLLLTKSLLPSRDQIYGWEGWDSTGPHPYHQQLIFQEKGDIDIAIIGSSQITHGIDTPYLQQKLSEKLGRPATVRTLGWGGAGFDALYITTRDLLEHRKVRMIVFYDECQTYNKPNSLAPNWFRIADNGRDLAGLPIKYQLAYYYAAVLGIPKNFLCLLRSNLPADMSPAKMAYVEHLYDADNIVQRLGSLAARHGYNYTGVLNDYTPYVEYTPAAQARPSDVLTYSPSNPNGFRFPGPPVPDWQLQFGKKFTELTRQYGVKLVLIHLPFINERRTTTVDEREFWPTALQGDITMVGIPPGVMFGGLTDDDIRKLFDDLWHLNRNGQEYYTSLLTPTLVDFYAAQVQP